MQIFYRDAVSKLSTFTSSLEGSNLNVHQNGAQRMHLEETLMKRLAIKVLRYLLRYIPVILPVIMIQIELWIV